PEQLAQIKSGFLFSDLIVFFDAGKAWNYSYTNPYVSTPQPNQQFFGFDDNPIVNSAGVSPRINLFGFAIIEPYMAYPFQHYNPQPTLGLYSSRGGFQREAANGEPVAGSRIRTCRLIRDFFLFLDPMISKIPN